MAIESVIELRIDGIEQLEDLERRLAALNSLSVNLSGGGGAVGGGGTTIQGGNYSNVTINEYNTNIQRQSRNDIHQFSRGLQAASSTLGGLTTGFMRLSKAILGTGGLLSGVTSMATIAGMLKTAQNINQAAFMTNAIGVNPNDLARLKATYGQVFNVEAVYSQVAKERAAPYSMLMTQMGISQQQAQMMSPEDLLLMTHQHARRMAQRYGANELALKAGGLEGVMSVEDLQREKNLSMGQMGEISASAASYQQRLQLQRPEDWQRFNRMMSLGTQSVGTAMQNLLRPLLDPLFNVFNEFFNRAFGPKNQAMFEEAVSVIGRGLNDIADFVKAGTWQELRDKLENGFIKSVEKASAFITDKFQSSLAMLDDNFRLFGLNVTQLMDSFKAFGYALEGVGRTLFEKGGPLESWKEEHGFGLRQWRKQVTDALGFAKGSVADTGHQMFDEKIIEVANKTGLPPALLFGLTQRESSFNPKATSPKGAMGLAQAMAPTWAQYGKGNPYNPGEALDFEGAYLLALHEQLGGGLDEMLAGYNAGPGRVRKAKAKAKRFGMEDWTKNLPLETRNYIDIVKENMAKARRAYTEVPTASTVSRPVYGSTRLDLNITNNTSADISSQTNRTGNAPNTQGR